MARVVEVDSAELQQQFLQLPPRLYRESPYWVSPFGDCEAESAGFGTHPVFEYFEARTYVAIENDEVVGRIQVGDNRACREWRKEPIGTFGFFECVDDQETANQLFEAGRQWLRSRNLKSMRGPISPSINYISGCQLDHFDEIPTSVMPYNHSYYAKLHEGFGFSKCVDLLSFRANLGMLEQLDPKVDRTVEMARDRFQIETRHFDVSRYRDDFETFYGIYEKSIARQFALYPPNLSEIHCLAEGFRPTFDPRFTLLAFVDGEPIGGLLGVPDINPAFVAAQGDPAGFESQAWKNRFSDVRRVRALITTVLPEYNKWGVGPLMHKTLLDQFLTDRSHHPSLQEIEYSWIFEHNLLSRGTVERCGAQLAKTHRIYEIEL